MTHPNLELLESAAEKLRPLLPEVVFVGGRATGLLITDPGAGPVLHTIDFLRRIAEGRSLWTWFGSVDQFIHNRRIRK